MVLGVIGIAVSALVWRAGGDIDAGTPPPIAVPLTKGEQRYYAAVAPLYRDVAAETRALAHLGAERSRNLLVILRGQDRVDTLLDEIDAYHSAHGVPDRFAAAGQSYRDGSARAREAMVEAQEGFRRFDWDRVARATTVFEAGAAALETALRQLDETVDGVGAEGRSEATISPLAVAPLVL